MDESVLVEVKSISRRFGELDAIKNVSFSVNKGQAATRHHRKTGSPEPGDSLGA